jgi:hypothetical protein
MVVAAGPDRFTDTGQVVIFMRSARPVTAVTPPARSEKADAGGFASTRELAEAIIGFPQRAADMEPSL